MLFEAASNGRLGAAVQGIESLLILPKRSACLPH